MDIIVQMFHIAYYLKSTNFEEYNRWEYYSPFKCTGKPPSKMALTIRFPGMASGLWRSSNRCLDIAHLDDKGTNEKIMITGRLDSGLMGTTPFTVPMIVNLGRRNASGLTSANIDFISEFLRQNTGLSEGIATEGTDSNEIILLD